MNTIEFLCKVLPTQDQGSYIAHMRKRGSDIHWNEGCATIEELADIGLKRSAQGHTAYFALGTYTNNLSIDPATGHERWGRSLRSSECLNHACACARCNCLDLVWVILCIKIQSIS